MSNSYQIKIEVGKKYSLDGNLAQKTINRIFCFATPDANDKNIKTYLIVEGYDSWFTLNEFVSRLCPVADLTEEKRIEIYEAIESMGYRAYSKEEVGKDFNLSPQEVDSLIDHYLNRVKPFMLV